MVTLEEGDEIVVALTRNRRSGVLKVVRTDGQIDSFAIEGVAIEALGTEVSFLDYEARGWGLAEEVSCVA